MNMRNNHRTQATALLAAGILGISAIPAAAAPPSDASGAVTFPAGSLCEFAVRLDITGKAKTIGSEPGTHKVISPGFKVTTTAVDDLGNPISAPVRYTATGTVFFTLTDRSVGPDYYEVKATGQNLLFVPNADGSTDLIYVVGNVNYAVELDKATEVRPFSGAARKTNICGPLA
ncbi:hypothetical protein [Arthrobacter sp. U41]|uniref:hypothetical protein n=1 Tax=Arthrobacter sp. U41 TaxID=1849032 RepID=UPI00119E7D08|nr:hypothetical protein [Arthrobacter sp. U41]